MLRAGKKHKGGKQDWRTPKWLFDWLNSRYGPFAIDVAASPENALCKIYLTEEDNALDPAQSWAVAEHLRPIATGSPSGVLWVPPVTYAFCNPPYAKIEPWLEKAWQQYVDAKVVTTLVLPAVGMGAKWWRKWRDKFDTTILTPRVAFEDGSGRSSPNGLTMILRPTIFSTFSYWDISDVMPVRRRQHAKNSVTKPAIVGVR